jgi:hypothetical protein
VFNPSEFHFSEVTFLQNWYFRCGWEFLGTAWSNASDTNLGRPQTTRGQ